MNLRNRIVTITAAAIITIAPATILATTTTASATTTTTDTISCTVAITGSTTDVSNWENNLAQFGGSMSADVSCTGNFTWNDASGNQGVVVLQAPYQPKTQIEFVPLSTSTITYNGTISVPALTSSQNLTTPNVQAQIDWANSWSSSTGTMQAGTAYEEQGTGWTVNPVGTVAWTVNGVTPPPPACSGFGVTGPQSVTPGHAYTFGLGWLGECDTIVFQTPLDPGFTTGNTPSDYQASFGGTYADAFFTYTSGNTWGGNAVMDVNLTNATATNWPNSWETQTEVWGISLAGGTTTAYNLGSLSGLIATTANGGQSIYTNPNAGNTTTPTTVPGTTCTGAVDPYPLQPTTTPCPTGTNPVQGAGFNFSQCTAGISMSLWNPGSWIAGAAQYGACVVELLFIPNTNNAFTQTIADAKTHIPFNYVSDTIDGANTLVNGLTTQAATGTCSPPTIAPWTGQTGALAGLAKFSFTVPLPTAVCGAQAGGIDPNVGNMWGFRPYWIDLLSIMIYLAAFAIIWETTPWGRNGATVIRAIGHADGYTLYSDHTASKDD